MYQKVNASPFTIFMQHIMDLLKTRSILFAIIGGEQFSVFVIENNNHFNMDLKYNHEETLLFSTLHNLYSHVRVL